MQKLVVQYIHLPFDWDEVAELGVIAHLLLLGMLNTAVCFSFLNVLVAALISQ